MFDDDAPQFHVSVAYGTRQRTTALRSGEFSILRARNRAAYETAGTSFKVGGTAGTFSCSGSAGAAAGFAEQGEVIREVGAAAAHHQVQVDRCGFIPGQFAVKSQGDQTTRFLA